VAPRYGGGVRGVYVADGHLPFGCTL